MTRHRSRMTPAAGNQEVHRLLKEGGKVRAVASRKERLAAGSEQQAAGSERRGRKEGERGAGEPTNRVTRRSKSLTGTSRGNNDFFLASQFWVTGEVYTRRADLVGPLIY